jgi:hypothetical protein
MTVANFIGISSDQFPLYSHISIRQHVASNTVCFYSKIPLNIKFFLF